MSVSANTGQSVHPAADRHGYGALASGAVGAALVAGFVAAVAGPIGVALAIGVGLVGLVAWRPVLAIYLYLATLPFLAGIGRGVVVPLLRPNEALLVLVIAGATAGGYVRAARGERLQFRRQPWDVPLAAFFVLATVWPISSMMLRGVTPSAADVAATLPACKLTGLYLLVRVTVRTPTQVMWCIRVIIGGAVGVAAVGVLQTLGVGPVLDLLATWWPTDPDRLDARGTATLNNAIATGDYILIGLTLLATSAARNLLNTWIRVGALLVLTAGFLAAGQVSVWLAGLLVGLLLGRRLPLTRGAAQRLAPIVGVAAVVGAPALVGRIKDLSEGSAPQSWVVRWDNLGRFYLPELVDHGRFLVGVSPNSVVIPPDTLREVVYLESGYLQLLWVGGVPLLVGFVVLSRAVITSTQPLNSRTDGVGAAASALAIVWWMVVFLSLLDSHLFMRGPSDLLFTLLGAVACGAAQERTDDVRP